MLSASHSQSDYYISHHADLALTIANQAAVAIENARLYAQAQELAALEERQKLAREMRDSVSQALYGISLGAHAARTALERDPQQVAEPLAYVLSLAEAALIEMRALIFELRPESLETEGLVSALAKQAAALQARHEIAISTDLYHEPDLPLKTKQAITRTFATPTDSSVSSKGAGKRLKRTSVRSRNVRRNGMLALLVWITGTSYNSRSPLCTSSRRNSRWRMTLARSLPPV